jgi:hypothetical protein
MIRKHTLKVGYEMNREYKESENFDTDREALEFMDKVVEMGAFRAFIIMD